MLLWSGMLSPFSAKVRIYLAERGIAYETREIPWSREKLWGPKPQAFLDANPRGEVPVLVDGDTTIFDSTLIWEYLEDAREQDPLLPDTLHERAVCRAWEDEADRYMAVHLTVLIRQGFLGGGDQEALTAARRAFEHYHDRLEAQLNQRSYLAGSFSVADIATFVCLQFAQTLGAEIGARANLCQWFERIGTRSAVQQEVGAILQSAATA